MFRTLAFASLSLALVAAIIYQPSEAFAASLQGLSVWWSIVFPGLLPFLTLLEIMLAFGAVHACGALIDPLTKRMLRMPGESGLALAIGWTGGFPAGAETTAALRKSGTVTREEGQRLLALSYMPSPLFILLVVGAGFFRRPELGLAIACSVWLASIAAAVVQTWWFNRRQPASAPSSTRQPPLLRRAAAAMAEARNRDGRTLGKVLGDSVTVSVAKLMAIGGFMMMAAVLVRMLELLIPHQITSLLIPALLESHIGTYTATTTALPGGLIWNAAATAAILAWGGISALLQAGHAIARTDLSLPKLAYSRMLHAVLAFGTALVLVQPLSSLLARFMKTAAPVWQWQDSGQSTAYYPIKLTDLPTLWSTMPLIIGVCAGCIALLICISIIYAAKRTPSN